MTQDLRPDGLDEAVRRLAAEVAPGLLEEVVAESRREAAAIVKAMLSDAIVLEAKRLLQDSGPPPVPIVRPETRQVSGWYVYGITRAEAAGALDMSGGVDGAPVEIVPVADLAAVVSPLSDTGGWDVEGSGETALEALAPRARAHEAVLEQMMDHGAVLPLRLGLLYPDLEALRGVLKARAGALRRALRDLEGHGEWGLTITAQGVEPDGGLSSVPVQGRDYLARRRAERRTAESRADRLSQIGNAFHEQLQDHCAAAVIHRAPTSPRRQADVVLRASYLVPRESTEAFRKDCEELLRKAPPELHLGGELTGPWPPYHFCDVSLDEVPA